MPPGTLSAAAHAAPRKLTDKIDGKDVFVVELVNDDLDQIDELVDEYSELERLKADIDVDASNDPDERKQLRAQIRDLTRQQRVLDTQMLGLYVEGKGNEKFPEDVLAKVPVRAQTALLKEAVERIYGAGEGPTPGTSASA